MHPNRAFAWHDGAAMLDFIADIGLCTIFVGADRGGHVLHVPVVVAGPDRLRFHVARANRATPGLEGSAVSLSCLGPHAYVSPDWYGTADQVPTWNYIAVEARGRLRRLEEAELIGQIDALSALHEARLAPKPLWARAKMTSGRAETMAKAIVGFEIMVTDLAGTRKLGQNKSVEERAGAVAGLRAAGQGNVAGLMAGEVI